MSEQGDALLKQLRNGGFGASGYVTASIETLCREVLSPTADPKAAQRIARRLQIIMPAFKEGLELRMFRTDRKDEAEET